MIYVDYNKSTIVQRAIAFFGCLIGGGIVCLLGIFGEFFEYDSLLKHGYGLFSVIFYAIVVLSAFLILSRVKYAILIAIGAELLEMLFYITNQVSSIANNSVSFLILIKLAVIFSCTQLMVKIVSFDDTPPSSRPKRQGPRPPQGRQVVRRQPPMTRR